MTPTPCTVVVQDGPKTILVKAEILYEGQERHYVRLLSSDGWSPKKRWEWKAGWSVLVDRKDVRT